MFQALLSALLSALTVQPKMTRGWRAVLTVLLCVIAWLALTPVPPRQADLGWDKLNHLSAFGTLAVVAVLGRCGPYGRIAAGLLAYGGLIELLQTFVPNRSGEWADLLADGVGIALGLLLAAGWRRLVVKSAAPAD